MNIRPAKISDAPNLAKIHVSGWQIAYRDIINPTQLRQMSIDKRTEQFTQAIKDKSEDIFKMVARQAIHYNDLLMSILVQIQEEYPGCFDGIDLELFSRSIYGICNWSLMWYKKDGKYSDDEIVEYYMKIFIYDKIGRG